MGTDKRKEAVVIEILKIHQWYLQEMIKHYEYEQTSYLKRKVMILRDYGFCEVNNELDAAPRNPTDY